MKISTRGKYGLRAMLDLAVHWGPDTVPLSSIAERQNISINYLEQVFSILRKAGLVKSIKGAQGGYFLGKPASQITVGEILRTLEGDLQLAGEEDAARGNNYEYCIRLNVWDRIEESIKEIVDSLTLEDLAKEYDKLNEQMAYMFYI